MSAPTHATFAAFIYLLVLTTTGVALNPLNAAIIMLSSLLPDIDTGASSIGRLIPFVSLRIERRFGHRTITHSVVCIAALAVAALPLAFTGRDLYVCILAGYASHPFLDTMTVNGVQLFHPFSSAKCVFPLEVNSPNRYRIRTGGRMDRTLGIIFLIGCAPTLYVAYQGYERFIRATQQNIDAGVRDYEELSRDHLVYASVSAYNMLTKQPLEGRFEIVGALNPHTLVFKGPDAQLHTMGKEFEADFVVRSILCSKGAPAKSSVRRIDAGNRVLSEIVSGLDGSAEHYLFGELSTSDKVSLPENIGMFTPVSGGGGAIRLTYATSDDIRACDIERVFVTKGMLTVKAIATEGHGFPDTAASGRPGSEALARIPVLLTAKDSVVMMKSDGDTVEENEVIATRGTARYTEEQKGILREKIHVLRNQADAESDKADRRIAEARQVSELDSVAAVRASELLQHGFIPEDASAKMRLNWLKNKRILSDLLASKEASAQKKEMEIQSCAFELRKLEAASEAAARASGIRSPVKGIVLSIRRRPLDSKTMMEILIRKLK